MIGSALGVLGAGALVSARFPDVLALSHGLNEPAQALQQAERLRLNATIGFPVELSTDLVIGTRFGGGHYGIDIWRADAEPGQALVACVDGELIFQEFLSGRQGNSWVLQGDDGNAYRYHHIDEFTEDLTLGDRVTTDQVIATMGETGNAGAPHLHFEVRLEKHNGTAVDPVPLLGLPIPGVTIY